MKNRCILHGHVFVMCISKDVQLFLAEVDVGTLIGSSTRSHSSIGEWFTSRTGMQRENYRQFRKQRKYDYVVD